MFAVWFGIFLVCLIGFLITFISLLTVTTANPNSKKIDKLYLLNTFWVIGVLIGLFGGMFTV